LHRTLQLMAFAAVGAVALPAVVLPVAGPAAAARVFFVAMPDVSNLPEGVTIDRWDGHQAVLVGVDAAAARALYGAGAAFIYPVRMAGCLSLSPK
jgi:hypothetical protein